MVQGVGPVKLAEVRFSLVLDTGFSIVVMACKLGLKMQVEAARRHVRQGIPRPET